MQIKLPFLQIKYTEYPGVNGHPALALPASEADGGREQAACPQRTMCSCDVRDSVEREWRTDANGCRTCGCFDPQTTPATTAAIVTTTPEPLLFDDPRIGGGQDADESPADRTIQGGGTGIDPSSSAMTADNNSGPNTAATDDPTSEQGLEPSAVRSRPVQSFRKHSNTSCFPSYAYANTQVYTEFDLRDAEQFTGFAAASAGMCLEVCSALASCGAAQYRHGPEGMCYILLSLRNVTLFGQDAAEGHTCFRRNPAATFGGDAAVLSDTDDGAGGDRVAVAYAPETTVFVGALPSSSTTQPRAGGESGGDVNAELERWLEKLHAFNDNSIYGNRGTSGAGGGASADLFATLLNATAWNAAAGAQQFYLSNTALGVMLGCIVGVVLFTVVVRHYMPSKHASVDLGGDGRRISAGRRNTSGSTRSYTNGARRSPRNVMRTNMDNVLNGARGGTPFRGDGFDLLGGGLPPTHRLNPLHNGRRGTADSSGSRNGGGPRVNGLREKQSSGAVTTTSDDFEDFGPARDGTTATRHIVREGGVQAPRTPGNQRRKASMLIKKQSSGAATSTSIGFSTMAPLRRNPSDSSVHRGFNRSSSQVLLAHQAEAILGASPDKADGFTSANESNVINRLVRNATASSADAHSILSGLDKFERAQSAGAVSVSASEMERFERAQSAGASSVTESEIEMLQVHVANLRQQNHEASEILSQAVSVAETEEIMKRNQMEGNLQRQLSANSEASSQAV